MELGIIIIFIKKKTDPTFFTPFLFIKYSKTTHESIFSIENTLIIGL